MIDPVQGRCDFSSEAIGGTSAIISGYFINIMQISGLVLLQQVPYLGLEEKNVQIKCHVTYTTEVKDWFALKTFK